MWGIKYSLFTTRSSSGHREVTELTKDNRLHSAQIFLSLKNWVQPTKQHEQQPQRVWGALGLLLNFPNSTHETHEITKDKTKHARTNSSSLTYALIRKPWLVPILPLTRTVRTLCLLRYRNYSEDQVLGLTAAAV